jgi:gamma-polyglutamate synthase
MLITFCALIIVISLLSLESFIVKKCIAGVNLRIHVNGTRGKSSVTEYIAAGLSTEKKVLAKITGIKPTIIYPDGKAEVIKRNGRARVQEQFKLIQLASKLNVDALVLECMSILPELQKLESRVLSPHIYIITNIRDDHREEMGNSLLEQAEAICSAIPYNSTVLTSEEYFLPLINKYALNRNCKVIQINSIDKKYSSLLPEGVFAINIALALAVCRLVGVNEDSAFNNILKIIRDEPDPLINLIINEKEIRFINGFAVNDVPSAEDFLKYWKNKYENTKEVLLILNTRNDRPVRSLQFAEWIGTLNSVSKVILTGTHIPRTRKEIIKSGFDKNKIFTWNKSQITNPLNSLDKIVSKNSIVFGLGNIAGDGFVILDSLYNSGVE